MLAIMTLKESVLVQKIRIITLVATLVAVMTNAAFAAIPIARGGYVEGLIGYSKVEDASGLDDANGLGANVNLGYKLLPFIAVEGGYATYGASNSSFTGAFTWDIAIKGIVPFSEAGVEAFAKFGPAYIYNQNVPDDGCKYTTNIMYGFGGSYAYRSNMLFNIAWTKSIGNSDTGDFQLLGLGITYMF